jgi:hypothetical protein
VLKEGRPVGWLHGSAINAEAILARCYANGSA